MNRMMTVIIPVFNESKILQNSINVIETVLTNEKIPHELIFVDDGSSDFTWEILIKNSKQCQNIRAIKLSRNFGKESAIFAGLDSAYGECCAVMDCDLQHPPECLIQMYRCWLYNDFDIIEGRKNSRGKESLFNRIGAALFYKLLNSTSGIDLKNASDFKLMDRKVVDIIREMPERQTFFRAMSRWVGFKVTQVYFDVADRSDMKSKWSTRRLVRLAINAITSYSALPMQIVTLCGTGFFVFSFLFAIQTLYMKLSGHAVEGFTTVIILLLFIGSVIMFSLGIIGIYLDKIYEEIKFRPRYIISDRLGAREGSENVGV